MKRIFIAICILLNATACTDELLNTVPADFLSPVAYYETEEQLNYALNAVYDVLGQTSLYKTDMLARLGMDGDEGYYDRETPPAAFGPATYNFTPGNPTILSFWTTLYSGISRANFLLSNLEKSQDVDAIVKDRIRGEALFLRGYYYFLLVQNFGGVPLLLAPTADAEATDVPRSSAKEVYEQIIADMEAAESLVAPITEIGFGGRVSKSAVRGILARVNLYMAGEPVKDATRYVAARDWAKKVMDDAEAAHRLNPDYTQVFINYAADAYDIEESIWEVEFQGSPGAYNETGSVGAWNGIASNNEIGGVNYGFIRATARLYLSYEGGDVRRDWNIAPFSFANDGTKNYFPTSTPESIYNRNAGKYRREYEVVKPKANNTTPINYPLLRFSDVLLMYAEAVNEISGPTAEAHYALNLVRERAHASLFEGPTAFADPNEFRNEIQNERSREFAFESLRKPDLIRWGIFVPSMKIVLDQMNTHIPGSFRSYTFRNVSDKHVIFPIPSRELTLNRALTQNDNW